MKWSDAPSLWQGLPIIRFSVNNQQKQKKLNLLKIRTVKKKRTEFSQKKTEIITPKNKPNINFRGKNRHCKKQTNTYFIYLQEVHVVWLDLESAYGSVPHLFITFAPEFFPIRTCIQNCCPATLAVSKSATPHSINSLLILLAGISLRKALQWVAQLLPSSLQQPSKLF